MLYYLRHLAKLADRRLVARASEIAAFLKGALIGPDVDITRMASLANASAGALLFASRADDELIERLNRTAGVLALVPPALEQRLACARIVCDKPRLAFAKVGNHFFAPEHVGRGVAPTATIGRGVVLGKDVSIGDYCVVGDGVSIGEGTTLMNHVVVGHGSVVGRHCLIKSHTVIGEDGFGYEPDSDGSQVKVPHTGRTLIGDYVHLGCFNSVPRATLDATVIEDHVKTDDHVHVGHNSRIGRGTLLTACAEISGSVTIGRNVWIGPNSSILDHVRIGDNAFVGIGSVVTKNVPDGESVAGNPARRLIKAEK